MSKPLTKDHQTMAMALWQIHQRKNAAPQADIFHLRQHQSSKGGAAPFTVQKQRGVTLVETVIGIIILSISFSAIASLLTNTVLNSATPTIRQQAISIAESHLETVLLQAYADPNQAETSTCEEGNDSFRRLYDDVTDFGCISDTDGARDAVGNLINGLGAYNVNIDIQPTTLHSAPALAIDVEVTHDGVSNMVVALRGYRVNYP